MHKIIKLLRIKINSRCDADLPRMFPLLLCSILWAVDDAVVDVAVAGVDSVAAVVLDDGAAAEQSRAFALVVEVLVGNGFVVVAATGTEPADII